MGYNWAKRKKTSMILVGLETRLIELYMDIKNTQKKVLWAEL